MEALMTKMKRAQILELIAQHAREVVPGLTDHVFAPSDRLVELGANSVDRAEITMLVQESLGLTVSRVELFGPTNIGQLADLFVSKLDAC
jgi:polyketide biosynthesis acyl carrier protein